MKFLLDNIILVALAVVSGAMLLWPMLRRSGGATVSPAEATMLINRQDAVVFDVRDAEAFAGGRIINARSVPAPQLETRLPELAKLRNRTVIVCDESGTKTAPLLASFQKHGFNNAVALAGGIAGWRQAGLPTEK